jgi:hypothetical protein
MAARDDVPVELAAWTAADLIRVYNHRDPSENL